MRVEVALVADDLTGALDAAAPFAARGLRVRVYRTVEALAAAPGAVGAAPPTGSAAFPTPGTPPDPTSADPFPERRGGLDSHDGGDSGVLAVNTSTRHLAPEAARAAVAAAARRLLAWSPRLVFKKIDSTLRGPAADEAAAAMEVFGRRAALVCPAFPAAGRVVRGGEVFVYGAPLRETEYVRDLRTPAPAEPLAAMFGRIGGRVRGLRPEEPLPDRPPAGCVIADAETEAHLARLAAFVRAHPKEVLAVGSDGLAAGLASLLGRPSPPVRLTGGEGRVLLFALGVPRRRDRGAARAAAGGGPGSASRWTPRPGRSTRGRWSGPPGGRAPRWPACPPLRAASRGRSRAPSRPGCGPQSRAWAAPAGSRPWRRPAGTRWRRSSTRSTSPRSTCSASSGPASRSAAPPSREGGASPS